jgi:hypothetical protein
MTTIFCQAQEFASGRTHCGRCRLDWLGSVQAGERIPCKSKADPPIGIPHMIATLLQQAKIVTDSQHAAIAAGYRREPYAPELRRAAVIAAAAQLLEKINADERIMEILKGG